MAMCHLKDGYFDYGIHSEAFSAMYQGAVVRLPLGNYSDGLSLLITTTIL